MNIDEILQELSRNKGYFPEEAVIAADSFQSELQTIFIEELTSIAEDPGHVQSKDETYMFHIYAVFFLAKWRVKQAFPILVKIFAQNTEDSDYIWGDLVTEDLPGILASVYTDEMDVLVGMMLDMSIGEFERSAVADSLLTLFVEGVISRESAVEILQRCLECCIDLNLENDYLPANLVCSLANLHPLDSMPIIEKAFQQGLVDPMTVTFDDIKRDARENRDKMLAKLKNSGCKRFVSDVVSQMSWWACFDETADTGEQEDFSFVQNPYVAPPKVGRNDPCPCGSVKKHKKCCMK
jgi:hypothetical protein